MANLRPPCAALPNKNTAGTAAAAQPGPAHVTDDRDIVQFRREKKGFRALALYENY